MKPMSTAAQVGDHTISTWKRPDLRIVLRGVNNRQEHL